MSRAVLPSLALFTWSLVGCGAFENKTPPTSPAERQTPTASKPAVSDHVDIGNDLKGRYIEGFTRDTFELYHHNKYDLREVELTILYCSNRRVVHQVVEHYFLWSSGDSRINYVDRKLNIDEVNVVIKAIAINEKGDKVKGERLWRYK